MNGFRGCLFKDRKEFFRKRINLICLAMILLCFFLVLGGTAIMPKLLAILSETNKNIIADDTSLTEFLNKFFPQNLSASLGIFASDIGVFYNLVMIFLTYSMLPEEITSGKMILPICAGHRKEHFLLSKEIIYGSLMSIPAFGGYMLYYLIGSSILNGDCDSRHIFINAVIMMASVFFVVNYTIVLSALTRAKYSALFFMVGVVLIGPDALSFLSIGRFFPTYILTYLYKFEMNIGRVIIPLCLNAIILVLLNVYALNGGMRVNVDTRR